MPGGSPGRTRGHGEGSTPQTQLKSSLDSLDTSGSTSWAGVAGPTAVGTQGHDTRCNRDGCRRRHTGQRPTASPRRPVLSAGPRQPAPDGQPPTASPQCRTPTAGPRRFAGRERHAACTPLGSQVCIDPNILTAALDSLWAELVRSCPECRQPAVLCMRLASRKPAVAALQSPDTVHGPQGAQVHGGCLAGRLPSGRSACWGPLAAPADASSVSLVVVRTRRLAMRNWNDREAPAPGHAGCAGESTSGPVLREQYPLAPPLPQGSQSPGEDPRDRAGVAQLTVPHLGPDTRPGGDDGDPVSRGLVLPRERAALAPATCSFVGTWTQSARDPVFPREAENQHFLCEAAWFFRVADLVGEPRCIAGHTGLWAPICDFRPGTPSPSPTARSLSDKKGRL